VPGGLIAGTLFVLPGALVIATLALVYAQFGTRPETTSVLLGIKACVLVIVAMALRKLARKALADRIAYLLASGSFVALFVFDLPFPVIIATAALIGALRSLPIRSDIPAPQRPMRPRTIGAWLIIWLSPLAALWVSGQSFLFELGAFFAKLAVVTFGGAYAVLAYLAQEVVTQRNWLETGQMIDALGLAETTPGPLILVTQFVGHLAGFGVGGIGFAVIAGVLTLWMTFVPCFLWIFAGAPYLENLLARPRIAGALKAITAAVVGVIANLSLWFALHVMFERVIHLRFGPASLIWPDVTSLVWAAIPLTVLCALLMGPLRRGIPLTLVACATTSWAFSLI
jgi:chromate transporter